MATIKFWSEMTKATTVDGEDKVMIGRNATGEAMYVDFQYLVNQAGAQTSDYIPIDGNTLPTLGTESKFSIVGSGTYTQSVGGDVVVPENSLGIIAWDGDEWVLNSVVTIPAPVGVDEIDPDGENLPKEKAVAKYTFSKKEYSYKYFENTITPISIKSNGLDILDDFEISKALKQIDDSIKKVEVFNFPNDHNIGIRTFGKNINGDLYISLDIFDGDGNQVYTNLNFYQSQSFGDGILKSVMAKANVPFIIEIEVDSNLIDYDHITLGFREGDYNEFERSGLKKSSLLHSEFTGFLEPFANNFRNGGGSDRYNAAKTLNKAILEFKLTSARKELVRLFSVTGGGTSLGAFIFLTACIDDGENIYVDNSKGGFSNLRIYLEGTGIQRLKSVVMSGNSTVEAEIKIDMDYLAINAPNILSNTNSVASIDEQFTWSVTPSSGGGGTGFFSQLTLLEGEEDFQGNFRFGSNGTQWRYNEDYNITKLIRIPDGAQELQFNMRLSGDSAQGWLLDENFKRVAFVNEDKNTVNNLRINVPTDAVFVIVTTDTLPAQCSIVAYGSMEINPDVKTYRTLHEGLGDRYSGLIFRVGDTVFEKLNDGLCTINEYKSLDDWTDDVSTFEIDGGMKQPMGVSYTGNNGTFDYGTLCAEKDGVMYFYNALACAVFKSEDYGNSYITICDKYSHPDLWDTEDINNGQSRNAIIPLNNGEILFPIRHRGDKFIDEQNSQRKERFYILCRTKNNQTEVERCFSFSHEDTLRHYLDPSDPQYNWPNHSTGCLLGDFTHDVWGDMIVVTEYGEGTSYYWRERGVASNARGISGRAWVSMDNGVTWKKFFDADRKISGLTEADDNWYWFSDTEARKMCHLHGIFIDKVRGVVHITNGDQEDYDFSVKVSDLISWYQNAPSVDPEEHPEYKTSDTFPHFDTFLIKERESQSNYAYSTMNYQMMSGVSVKDGELWGHDASREFAYITRETSTGRVCEPTFQFELLQDYQSMQDFVFSWGTTDGFVQDIKNIDGTTFFVHSHRDAPNRIWASKNGYDWKIVFETSPNTFGFGSVFVKSGDAFYITNSKTKDIEDIGYWKLKEV